jgi:hypothetical protein
MGRTEMGMDGMARICKTQMGMYDTAGMGRKHMCMGMYGTARVVRTKMRRRQYGTAGIGRT